MPNLISFSNTSKSLNLNKVTYHHLLLLPKTLLLLLLPQVTLNFPLLLLLTLNNHNNQLLRITNNHKLHPEMTHINLHHKMSLTLTTPLTKPPKTHLRLTTLLATLTHLTPKTPPTTHNPPTQPIPTNWPSTLASTLPFTPSVTYM